MIRDLAKEDAFIRMEMSLKACGSQARGLMVKESTLLLMEEHILVKWKMTYHMALERKLQYLVKNMKAIIIMEPNKVKELYNGRMAKSMKEIGPKI